MFKHVKQSGFAVVLTLGIIAGVATVATSVASYRDSVKNAAQVSAMNVQIGELKKELVAEKRDEYAVQEQVANLAKTVSSIGKEKADRTDLARVDLEMKGIEKKIDSTNGRK